MRPGTVDEPNERPQLKCKGIVVAERRIERKSVPVSNCESATRQVPGEIEHRLDFSRGISTQSTFPPPFSNRRYDSDPKALAATSELPSVAAQDWHTPAKVGREPVSLLHAIKGDTDIECLCANAWQFARREGGEQRRI